MKILLSVSNMDSSFQKMKDELEKVASVDVCGVSDFSLKGYDLFIGKKMTSDILKTQDRLKAIFAYKTGIDDFPLDEINELGIKIYNSHAASRYIAEYAFALSLALTMRLNERDRNLRKGDWDNDDPLWSSPFNMTFGLVGFGSIGQDVYKILEDNHIKAYTINRGKKYPSSIGLVDSLESLCKVCDLLIVSLPKTPETDKIFNKDIFKLLKGKYIVNVGRSNCLDEHDLYLSLKSNELAGIANDAWDKKGKGDEAFFPSEERFYELDNFLLSSHKASMAIDGHDKYVMDCLDQVLRYIKNDTSLQSVDLTKKY